MNHNYNEFFIFRYVHIGPVLTNLILRAESSSPSPHHSSIELDEDSAPLQQLWRLLALPQKVTLMLCANSLPQQRQYALPANMVLVQYGFQVCLFYLLNIILFLIFLMLMISS